jgi:hypothetical protein
MNNSLSHAELISIAEEYGTYSMFTSQENKEQYGSFKVTIFRFSKGTYQRKRTPVYQESGSKC